MADDEMYLDNLKEFVIDEDRIVTYKWLSRSLSVNVNQAKQMLYAFIQQQQQQNANSLHITYTVGGLMKDKNGNIITKYLFCNEEDLKDIKHCYEKITSLHVYSIQKAKPKDSNVLYLADYDLQKQNLDSPNRWSNIILKSMTKRNTEIHEDFVDEHKRKNNETKEPISNGFHKPVEKKVQNSGQSTSRSTKNSKAKPTMKKGDVASFFARQAASTCKSKETDKSVDVNCKRHEEVKKGEESKNKMEKDKEQSKPHSLPVDKNVKSEKDEEGSKEQVINTQHFETTENDDKLKTKFDDRPEEDCKTKKSGEEKSLKSEKTNQNEKENQRKEKKRKTKASPEEANNESEGKKKPQRKKRKRVKNFSDTSSEEEDNSVNSKQSNSTDSTPIPDEQAQDVKTEKQKIRRRKRVLKSKTYLNDDGYMVTEKAYESETASSEEDEPNKPNTEIIKPNEEALKDSIQPPKKRPANKVTKQASLTSFFKRT